MPASSAPRPPTRTMSAAGSRGALTVLAEAGASLTRERGIECGARRLEVHRAHELARLLGAVLAVHADVLPLHRERTFVLHRVELADDLLEVDAAAAERAELP